MAMQSGVVAAVVSMLGLAIVAEVGAAQPGTTTPADQGQRSGPVAIAGGTPVQGGDLLASLAELSGSIALEEALIDRALAVKEGEGVIRLAPDAEEAELRAMLASMQEEARVGPEEAGRLLAEVRAARGLGPTRFRALLRRNAGLRALVAGSVEATPEETRLAEEAEFGPRYRVRLITATDRAEITGVAERVGRAVKAGVPGWVAFAEEAVVHSRHATASRGGLMAEVSAADYSLPATVRGALGSTAPGTVSEVLATTEGYALVLVERVTPGNASPTEEQRRAVAAKLRRRLERLAMDRAARDLLEGARVTVFDASLRWSWEHRPR